MWCFDGVIVVNCVVNVVFKHRCFGARKNTPTFLTLFLRSLGVVHQIALRVARRVLAMAIGDRKSLRDDKQKNREPRLQSCMWFNCWFLLEVYD